MPSAHRGRPPLLAYPGGMTSQQPGRLPAVVYRRRRIVVGLALLAVIVVIVLLFIPRGGGDPTNGTSKSPSPSASDTPKADGSATCDPAVIALTAVTDKGSYAAGEIPQISMTITNTGTAPCTFDVGTAAQLYSIVSGSDPIWNSRDCQSDPQSHEQVLDPGVELSTTPFPWDRTRSSADTCTAQRPAVTAGGATYRLSVELGAAKSADDTPFLLN